MRTPSRSMLGEAPSRGRLLETNSSRGQLLETNFDETPQHTRSASYSSMGLQVRFCFANYNDDHNDDVDVDDDHDSNEESHPEEDVTKLLTGVGSRAQPYSIDF